MELAVELKGSNSPTIIDVREAYELGISCLPHVIHIPLSQLPGKLGGLNKDGNYVILCRIGGRSAQATSYLLQNGFTNVRNITSGINGWADTVDPTLEKY